MRNTIQWEIHESKQQRSQQNNIITLITGDHKKQVKNTHIWVLYEIETVILTFVFATYGFEMVETFFAISMKGSAKQDIWRGFDLDKINDTWDLDVRWWSPDLC